MKTSTLHTLLLNNLSFPARSMYARNLCIQAYYRIFLKIMCYCISQKTNIVEPLYKRWPATSTVCWHSLARQPLPSALRLLRVIAVARWVGAGGRETSVDTTGAPICNEYHYRKQTREPHSVDMQWISLQKTNEGTRPSRFVYRVYNNYSFREQLLQWMQCYKCWPNTKGCLCFLEVHPLAALTSQIA